MISMFFLYKINHQMWSSHASVVLQPVSYVHRTEPATVLPGCQGDSWAGLQVVESPRQWLRHLGKPSEVPTTTLLKPPLPLRHSVRPQPCLYPFPCSPHPVTYRGGRKDLASLGWGLFQMLRLLLGWGVGCGAECLILGLEICWVKRHSGLCVIFQQRPWEVQKQQRCDLCATPW